MNGNRNSQRSTRKAPPQNAPSVLLNDQENRCLFNLLGKKCVTMATGVAQVFLANGANGTWIKSCTGVCCFVKDNLKRSYFIRVYSLKKSVLQWEQEMYNEFEYMAPRPYFLTFATNECRAALNFANENEAEKFRKILDEKIRAKKDGKQRRATAPPPPPPESTIDSLLTALSLKKSSALAVVEKSSKTESASSLLLALKIANGDLSYLNEGQQVESGKRNRSSNNNISSTESDDYVDYDQFYGGGGPTNKSSSHKQQSSGHPNHGHHHHLDYAKLPPRGGAFNSSVQHSDVINGANHSSIAPLPPRREPSPNCNKSRFHNVMGRLRQNQNGGGNGIEDESPPKRQYHRRENKKQQQPRGFLSLGRTAGKLLTTSSNENNSNAVVNLSYSIDDVSATAIDNVHSSFTCHKPPPVISRPSRWRSKLLRSVSKWKLSGHHHHHDHHHDKSHHGISKISVPLTNDQINAEYELKLNKRISTTEHSLNLISDFISKSKCVERRCLYNTLPHRSVLRNGDVILQVEKPTVVTLPHHNSGSNIAKSAPPIPSHNKPPPPAAVQPPTRQHISSHLTVVDAKPQESNKKKDKKKKKNKSKISKADISSPSGFQHVTHVGWDPEKNSFDMNKVDDSVKELFSSAGITEKDMEDEETAKFIYDFIEKQGGIDAVKNQDRRRPPPAPPGHGGAVPPPPPPRKDGAPPPPRRNDNMRGGPPPPPPQRRPAGPPPPKSSSSGGGKPPPPPPSRSAPSLQQPPPPPPVASAIPAPPPMPPGGCIPPPPPPVMSVATPAPSRGAQTPLPPVSNARGNLLDQIRLGSPGLKSAAERNIPAPEPTPAGGRGALLDAIKLGKSLKPLSARIDKESPGSSESDGGGGGIADALKNALKKRENKIHSDSDSSEGDVDSDEWSD